MISFRPVSLVGLGANVLLFLGLGVLVAVIAEAEGIGVVQHRVSWIAVGLCINMVISTVADYLRRQKKAVVDDDLGGWQS